MKFAVSYYQQEAMWSKSVAVDSEAFVQKFSKDLGYWAPGAGSVIRLSGYQLKEPDHFL